MAQRKWAAPKEPPTFLKALDLEVDLRAEAEVTTHDVRTSPGRVEAEQTIGRVGIERRLGVEEVENVRVNRELVPNLLRNRHVEVPDVLGLTIDRRAIDIGMRRGAIFRVERAIALDAAEVDRRRVIALGVIGRQADRGVAEFQRVLPRRTPRRRTRAGRDVAGAERTFVAEHIASVGLQLI